MLIIDGLNKSSLKCAKKHLTITKDDVFKADQRAHVLFGIAPIKCCPTKRALDAGSLRDLQVLPYRT